MVLSLPPSLALSSSLPVVLSSLALSTPFGHYIIIPDRDRVLKETPSISLSL